MYTLSSFDRRLVAERGEIREVSLAAGEVRWLDAQIHSGENIGQTPTHVLFVELKDQQSAGAAPSRTLGPT
jgi:beta-alanine degradation protein BauB